MPLSAKGKEIMSNMKSEYGAEKGEQVFYASKNAGTIHGVDDSLVPAPAEVHLPMTISNQQTIEHARSRWDVWNCNAPDKT